MARRWVLEWLTEWLIELRSIGYISWEIEPAIGLPRMLLYISAYEQGGICRVGTAGTCPGHWISSYDTEFVLICYGHSISSPLTDYECLHMNSHYSQSPGKWISRQFNWLCLWTVFGSASVPINVRYLGLKQLCAKTLDTRWRLSLVKQRPFVVIVNEQKCITSVGYRPITGSPTSFSGLRPNPAKFKTKRP